MSDNLNSEVTTYPENQKDMLEYLYKMKMRITPVIIKEEISHIRQKVRRRLRRLGVRVEGRNENSKNISIKRRDG